MNKAKKGKIDLTIRAHRALPSVHKVSVVKGEGTKDFQFPKNLAERVIERIKKEKPKVKETKDATEDGAGETFLFRKGGLWDIIRPAVPKVRDADFQALITGADAIQRLMVERQFDSLMDQLFGEMESSAKWAITNMDVRFRPAIADHQRQVATLRQKVEEALPLVLKELAKRNPKVPVQALLQHAVEMLMQELAPILQVLSIYTTVFRQYQDGRFARKLQAINQYMKSCFDLVHNAELPTSSFKVGDVLLAGFGGPGLGTIPGSRGPIGMHLLLVPLDMQDWLSVSLPLLSHESRHQIFSDIVGLEEEVQAVLKTAITKACAPTGTVKLKNERTKVGRQMLDTKDLLIKLMTDCIGEIDADLGGGVLFTGPAYLHAMLLSFPAMLIRGGRVKDAKQLLRPSSVYNLVAQEDGTVTLEFEAHPPDWIRTHIVAAGLELVGYKSDADKLRKLADDAVGEVPEAITWADESGKSSSIISIAAVDIKAIALIVAKTIMYEPLKALNGKKLSDIVMWTPERQAKVDMLSALQLVDKAELPKDQGTILPTYVGAAAATSFWQAVRTMDPLKFLPKLEETTLKMLEALR